MTHTLTGKRRHRLYKPWFRAPVLVLQVEMRVTGVEWRYSPYDVDRVEVDNTFWRDATAEDLTEVAA